MTFSMEGPWGHRADADGHPKLWSATIYPAAERS
jgi:hypothetical protein